MTRLRFSHSYRSILNVTRNVGIPLYFGDNQTGFSRIKFICMYIIIALFLIWKISCAGIAVFRNAFEDQMLAESTGTLKLQGVLLMGYYAVWGRDLERLFQDLDGLSDMILNSSLGKERFFIQTYTASGNWLSKFHRIFTLNTLFCPFVFCFSHLAVTYYQGTYGQTLPVPIYCLYEKGASGKLEFFVFLQFLGLATPALQKLGNEFILFGLLQIQSTNFQYLSEAMKTIKNDIAKQPKSVTKEKIICWIKIHQRSIKFSQDMQRVYSPIIIIYYMSVITFTATGLFYNLNGDDASVIQTVTSELYIFSSLLLFYILCHMADNLNEEASKVAAAVYFVPWHELDQESKTLLQLAICLANKPLVMTAYKSPAFTLNREAFLNFVVNIVSAYMGFSKIRDIE